MDMRGQSEVILPTIYYYKLGRRNQEVYVRIYVEFLGETITFYAFAKKKFERKTTLYYEYHH